MRFPNLHDRRQRVYISNLVLLAIVFFCIIFGCAFIPEQEQLVSARVDEPLIRSNGNCTEAALTHGEQKTEAPIPGFAPDSITILDWNMYKGQRMGWEEDFLRLSSGKDIVLLQEASLSDKLQDLLQQKNLYWNLNSGFRYKGVETGVLIASTIESLGSCGMRYNEPIVGLPKTILINRYGIIDSEDELWVVTVHGINITLGTHAYKAQFQALGEILKKHKGPLILAGDFNNWSDKRIAVIDHLIEDLFLSILPFKDGGRTRFFGDPVDHVLYRGLEPISHMVHPVTSSDHNPISVTFRLVQNKGKN